MENSNHTIKRDFYYPPGGILIWIIVFLELTTFAIAISVFLTQRLADLSAFSYAQTHLNSTIGMINTLVLLTSGLFMALGLGQLKQGKSQSSFHHLSFALLLAVIFIVIKGFEYYEKIELGLELNSSVFFQFYWFLTVFHLLHVLVAIALLSYMIIKIRAGHYHAANHEDVETVGVFWHMCDLIWVMLFPILYLLH